MQFADSVLAVFGNLAFVSDVMGQAKLGTVLALPCAAVLLYIGGTRFMNLAR